MQDYLGNNLMGRWTRTTASRSMSRSTSWGRWYTTRRPKRESETASVSKLLVVVETIELMPLYLV